VPLHMRGNAASALAARAKGGFVRVAVIQRLDDYAVAANVQSNGPHRSMSI